MFLIVLPLFCPHYVGHLYHAIRTLANCPITNFSIKFNVFTLLQAVSLLGVSSAVHKGMQLFWLVNPSEVGRDNVTGLTPSDVKKAVFSRQPLLF